MMRASTKPEITPMEQRSVVSPRKRSTGSPPKSKLRQDFVEAYSPQDAGNPSTLAALDRAFAAWLGTQQRDSKAINDTINCVGVAFGQFLVDGIGLAWVIATDQHGSDLAVYGMPGKGDVLVYPANFVAKRWERRQTNFLETSYAQLAMDVQAISEANAAKDVA